ncbi:cholecystokinin receptor-like [Mya arenaria]|uniref:cholecystokinin receptor-like n=1 Tax=Mya arenaria TaxID=6604 RepID=UPI0022E514FD|nr:cholecystokinin receptor-like [Mya arenaria]
MATDSAPEHLVGEYGGEYMYDDYYAAYYNGTPMYEMDDSMLHLPLSEFLPTVLVYSIVGLFGLVGNLLVIFSIARVKRMRTITNLFLISLASADLLLVCVCVPVRCIAFYSYTWRLGEFMCRATNYVQHVSMICSALTLTAMSVERFFAIRFPLRARSMCTKRHASVVILCTWFASCLAAIPVIFAIEYREVGLRVKAQWCHKYYHDKPILGRSFEIYMLALILVIPCTVMGVTYTWIANIIWHVATRRADMRSGSCISEAGGDKSTSNGTSHVSANGSDVTNRPAFVPLTSPLAVSPSTKAYMDDDKTRKQVVLMLMVVVVLFAVCWTPLLVNNVLAAFDIIDYLHMGALKPLRITFHILAYANSSINPFVYAFMSKNFRDGFRQSVIVCIRGEAYLKRTKTSARSMTSMTRASTSNGVDRIAGLHSESLAMRRPSEQV